VAKRAAPTRMTLTAALKVGTKLWLYNNQGIITDEAGGRVARKLLESITQEKLLRVGQNFTNVLNELADDGTISRLREANRDTAIRLEATLDADQVAELRRQWPQAQKLIIRHIQPNVRPAPTKPASGKPPAKKVTARVGDSERDRPQASVKGGKIGRSRAKAATAAATTKEEATDTGTAAATPPATSDTGDTPAIAAVNDLIERYNWAWTKENLAKEHLAGLTAEREKLEKEVKAILDAAKSVPTVLSTSDEDVPLRPGYIAP